MRASTRFISGSGILPVGRNIVITGLCVAAVGCAPAVVVYRSPAEALASEYERSLRMRTVTGERYTIHHGSVRNDTLYATLVSVPPGVDSTIALPLDAISSIQRVGRGPSAYSAGLMGLGVGVVAGFLLTVLVAVGLSSG